MKKIFAVLCLTMLSFGIFYTYAQAIDPPIYKVWLGDKDTCEEGGDFLCAEGPF